jgi:hypothetical protein
MRSFVQTATSVETKTQTGIPGAASLGIVGLGHIKPVPGIAAHPDTFEFPSICRWLEGPDVLRQALYAEPELYPAVLAAAEETVHNGARAVLTTCGYFTPYQERLAASLPVPVVTSSLLQLPSLLMTLPPARSVLVVAAVGEALDSRCLAAAGVPDTSRVRVLGLDCPGPFQEQVLAAGGLHDIGALIDQVVSAVDKAIRDDPSIGAICLECGDLALASAALRARSGLQVVDYVTVANWLYSSTSGKGR